MTSDRQTRYQQLFERLGEERARALMDKLQVVALTSPETLDELEAFLDRSVGDKRPVAGTARVDRGGDADR